MSLENDLVFSGASTTKIQMVFIFNPTSQWSMNHLDQLLGPIPSILELQILPSFFNASITTYGALS